METGVMETMDGGRVAVAISRVGSNPGLTKLAGKMGIDVAEHAAYQNAQSSAHADGRLTLGEAHLVYRSLGEHWDPEHDGWATDDLATQVVVTRLMGELMGVAG